MKIKEFVKAHKRELIIGGTVLAITGIVVIKFKPTGIGKTIGTFYPNVENDTVDFLIKMKNGKNYLFAFDYGELPGLAAELEDAIECIRPEG